MKGRVHIMKTRQEIKAIAKTQFKSNYWNCVLALLLVSVVLGVISVIGSAQNVQQITSGGDGAVSATLSVRAGVGGLLSLLLSGPLTIGLNFFFVKNYIGARDEISVTTPFSQAFTNYPRKLGGSLWMALFIFLWSLLFIVPGIIKAYEYRLVPYIVSENPSIICSLPFIHHCTHSSLLSLSRINWFFCTGFARYGRVPSLPDTLIMIRFRAIRTSSPITRF